MNNLELGYHELGHNYGYYIDRISQNVFSELKQQVDNLQSNFNKGIKINDKLAGEIKHEYGLKPQPQTKQYIKDLSQRFENESQYMSSNYSPLPTLKFDNLWVNFQQKHEYNPIHNHDGVYSFVIWYQIPYTFENEKIYHYGSVDGSSCTHGQFSFVVQESFNKQSHIRMYPLSVDKSKQGYVAIFPSSLSHIVYPFYSSDKYRITIAGNITTV